MRTVRLIALREIREHGRSKSYILTSILILLLVVGLVVVPQLIGGPEEHTLGVVGEGHEEIVAAAAEVATADDETGEPPSVTIDTVEFDTREDALAALEDGSIDAVLVEDTELIVEGGGFGGSDLAALLQQGASAVQLERLIAEEGQTAIEVIEVMTSDPLEVTTASGEDAGDDSRALIAYAGLLLLYMAILVYGTWILSGVTEEKSSRVVEVLLSSVRPWELLAGKIAGIGTLGMTQFLLTVLTGFLALRITGAVEIPAASPVTVANLVLWFILGFVLYAVMFGAAGSLASRPEDAQNVAFPMSMIAVIGLFVSFATLETPDGLAATIGTFLPLTAPFVVPVRVALESIPLWQYVASIVLTVAATVGMVFVGGRIYSGGLLQFSGWVGVRAAWRGGAR